MFYRIRHARKTLCHKRPAATLARLARGELRPLIPLRFIQATRLEASGTRWGGGAGEGELRRPGAAEHSLKAGDHGSRLLGIGLALNRNTRSISSFLGTLPNSSCKARAIFALRSLFFCSGLAILKLLSQNSLNLSRYETMF
jgi:hypothetical protein